ncbi:MAG: WbqC family protein [Bacteroidales bacterium]|nr:WbqC family protein [Bacteroidales bacterium]
MTILLPTAYLPPISYISACAAADEILVEAWETYPKQTSRNHCEIAGPNGRQRLTVPVNKPDGTHTKTKDIRIASHLPWQKIHWRSFEAAYNKSPFFLYYKDYLLPFYEKDYEFLLDFDLQLLETLFQAIRLDKSTVTTESYEEAPPGIIDLRNQLAVSSLQSPVTSNQSPVSNLPEYYQVFADRNGFMSDLSIVDLLFNLGPETLQYFS